jgi:hypothetical protein
VIALTEMREATMADLVHASRKPVIRKSGHDFGLMDALRRG